MTIEKKVTVRARFFDESGRARGESWERHSRASSRDD
jgi:hypothetical protein